MNYHGVRLSGENSWKYFEVSGEEFIAGNNGNLAHQRVSSHVEITYKKTMKAILM